MSVSHTLDTYVQADARDDSLAAATGSWSREERQAQEQRLQELKLAKEQKARAEANSQRGRQSRFHVRPGAKRGTAGAGSTHAPPASPQDYSDLLLIYNLWDPTGELPEDRIGLAVSMSGLTFIDPETREQELFLNWARIDDWTGLVQSPGSDDMEIVVIRTIDMDEFQFECDDAKLVVGVITAACKSAAAAAGGLQSAREHRASTNLSVSGQDMSAASEKEKAADMRKEHSKNLYTSIAQIAIFLFLGWLVLAKGFGELKVDVDDETGEMQMIPWTVIDCIYFGFVTITTVGYGDLTPSSTGARVFVIFYAAFGVIALGICMRRIAKIVLEKQEMIQRKVASAMVAGGAIRRDMKGKAVIQRKTRPKERDRRREAAERSRKTKKLRSALGIKRADFRKYGELMVALVPMLIVMGGGFAVGVIEGWGFADSAYWVVITMLSVGYGDLSPKSQGGRLFALIFIPIAVVALMNVISSLYEITTKYSKRRLTSLKALLQMDRDGNGEVNLAEFQLFMLKHMGKFSDADLRMTREQFIQLDKTGDGLLNADDIDVEAVPSNAKVVV